MDITLQNIKKKYIEGSSHQVIFSELSAFFPSSRFSVILGRSGSGKSTILNLIGGIDTPDGGKVIIGDQEIHDLSDTERTLFRRREIGFIFQFFNLIPTLTVLENVKLISDLDGKSDQKQNDHAISIIEQVGLGDRLKTTPENLSGGEQQRVAIARALAHNPSIILADEPTGNLDKNTSASILEMLTSLIKKNKTTMVMATHSQEVIPFADHVFTIREGNLIEQKQG